MANNKSKPTGGEPGYPQLVCRCTPAQRQVVDDIANEMDLSISQIIKLALKAFVEKQGRQWPKNRQREE